jgi:hypothetical protein
MEVEWLDLSLLLRIPSLGSTPPTPDELDASAIRIA